MKRKGRKNGVGRELRKEKIRRFLHEGRKRED
jgi:hypothetical protein